MRDSTNTVGRDTIVIDYGDLSSVPCPERSPPARPLISAHRLLGQKLRQYSITTWFFERAFWMPHQMSPGRLVRRSRIAHVNSEAFPTDTHGSTARRSRRVEGYILTSLGIEAVLIAGVVELLVCFLIIYASID